MNLADLIPATWVAKLEAAGIAFILGVSILLGIYFAGRHAGVQAEAPKVAAANHAAADATAQTGVTTTAATAADQASTKALAITVTAEEAARAVQSAPGASDALPPDVLASWRAGIDGVRSPSAAAPDGAGGGQPAGAVPSAGD